MKLRLSKANTGGANANSQTFQRSFSKKQRMANNMDK